MRYGPMEQQRVNSSLQGRGLGVRHQGGGATFNGGKGAAPTGGFLRAPGQAGLQVMGMQPNPGALTPTGGLFSGTMYQNPTSTRSGMK